MALRSYVGGAWFEATDEGVPLFDGMFTGAEGVHGTQPSGPQAGGLQVSDCRGGALQPRLQLDSKFLFIHSVIPFELRIFANACVAREQCVFTLPSEHPMTLAVSLTSSSSQ